jgi:acetyltransferase-like isoleucine patch superfamily enzyme
MKYNNIHSTVELPDFVTIGKFNRIGKNVVIQAIRGAKNPKLYIGDCNVINDNVKILVGDAGVVIKDWNVIHNDILIIGEDRVEIGHNCWFGQNTVIDGSGVLIIGNGVRVGMYSQIWTHVASGEQIEGCVLYAKRKTEIHNNVWLVGSCIVGSGIILAERTTYLINSVVTKDTEPNKVYSGSPAKVMEKLNFYKDTSPYEKFNMLLDWSKEYAMENKELNVERVNESEIHISDLSGNKLKFIGNTKEFEREKPNVTVFDMETKSFVKKLTELERSFYTFLYNNKARFTPID